MLKGGEELTEEQQAFALEYNLYEVLILGKNAAKLLSEEEEKKEKERMEEVERVRMEMIMKRVENPEYEEEEEGEAEADEKKEIDSKAMVVAKNVPVIGSNGRPKVHRKGRRMAEEGRWIDRPPPSKPAPETVTRVDAPTQIFDRKGKPLKQKKSKGRRSKSTSRNTSKNVSRNISPTQEFLEQTQTPVTPAVDPAPGRKELTPAEKILRVQSEEVSRESVFLEDRCACISKLECSVMNNSMQAQTQLLSLSLHEAIRSEIFFLILLFTRKVPSIRRGF